MDRLDKWIDRLDEWMDRLDDGWIDWINGWIDWINGWIDWIYLFFYQVFGSKVRVDSTQKIAELEIAEKVIII